MFNNRKDCILFGLCLAKKKEERKKERRKKMNKTKIVVFGFIDLVKS